MTKTTEKVKINRDEGGLIRDATQSGIQVKVAYSPEDIAGHSQDEIGMPGCYPYTRGIYKNMYRDRLWLKSFIVSYATPEDTNAAFKSYIKQGLTDVRLLCDLPTQCGLDPDHPSSWNSMMCGGVASYAINTYEKMLDGMELENTQFELAHQNVSNFHYFHAVIVAMMENEGLNIAKLKGNGICDTVRAKLVYASPEWTTEINRRVSLDHIEYCLQDTPKWKAVVPNGVDICQAGMNAIHEIGTVLAGCIAIMEDLKSRDITLTITAAWS
jgi:methylmalonyl-CoA mutase N-terminal domain/subunit